MAQNFSAIMDLPVTLMLSDGSNETFSVGDVDRYYIYSVEVGIIYASQLGATLLLLVVVALTTTANRRRSAMFGLNGAALLANAIRLVLGCLYFTGPFNEFYIYFASGLDNDLATVVPAATYGTSVAAVVVGFLLVALVMAALALQAHVVLVTMAPRWCRLVLETVSLTIALTEVGFRLAYAVINIRAILGDVVDQSFDRLTNVKTYITAFAILWFSCVFTCRLGYTIYRRRRMGVKKLGPMEILFVVGGQTMIIPAIFAIVQLCNVGLPVMDSNVLTCLVLFLPLSSLWASAIVDHRHHRRDLPSPIEMTGFASDRYGSRRAFFKLPSSVGSKLRSYGSKFKSHTDESSTTGSSSLSPYSSTKGRLEGVKLDLEMQGF